MVNEKDFPHQHILYTDYLLSAISKSKETKTKNGVFAAAAVAVVYNVFGNRMKSLPELARDSAERMQ